MSKKLSVTMLGDDPTHALRAACPFCAFVAVDLDELAAHMIFGCRTFFRYFVAEANPKAVAEGCQCQRCHAYRERITNPDGSDAPA